MSRRSKKIAAARRRDWEVSKLTPADALASMARPAPLLCATCQEPGGELMAYTDFGRIVFRHPHCGGLVTMEAR